jgi:hypothetical protein
MPHCSWKAAAGAYLDVGTRLLRELQGEAGAVITESLLSEVAVAREALEKADGAYNAALDKLEVSAWPTPQHSTQPSITQQQACRRVGMTP